MEMLIGKNTQLNKNNSKPSWIAEKAEFLGFTSEQILEMPYDRLLLITGLLEKAYSKKEDQQTIYERKTGRKDF